MKPRYIPRKYWPVLDRDSVRKDIAAGRYTPWAYVPEGHPRRPDGMPLPTFHQGPVKLHKRPFVGLYRTHPKWGPRYRKNWVKLDADTFFSIVDFFGFELRRHVDGHVIKLYPSRLLLAVS